ncbi:MAG: F0F1 ATP synthase subunit A [Candidatus Velamenicoccus archaeovorus]
MPLPTVLAELSRPPKGFEAPGTGIFDYTKNCFIGDGSYCVTRPTFWVLVSVVIIGVLFVAAFRRPRLVPRGLQNALEALVDFIRNGIVMEVIGPEGLRFVPFLTSLFVFIWVNNTFEVIPFIQFPPTSRIAIPLVMTAIVYVTFNVVGIARQGGLHYLKGILFPPGVPWYIYPLYSPIELVSVFLVRPLTLTVRLAANMIAGHLILTVFFLGTWYLQWKLATIPFAAASFALGTLITGFELLVGVLQAYIFTILTAVYIAGAIHPEH